MSLKRKPTNLFAPFILNSKSGADKQTRIDRWALAWSNQFRRDMVVKKPESEEVQPTLRRAAETAS